MLGAAHHHVDVAAATFCEHTSRSRQSGTVVAAPYRSAIKGSIYQLSEAGGFVKAYRR
jgi:hypothetical protein